jgi:Rieske Fe-S protein
MADPKEPSDKAPDRRRFLKIATCALGGGVGLVLVAPAIRLAIDPAGQTTVTSPTEPLDVGSLDRFKLGQPPRRVDVVAPLVKDAWITSRNVVLGAAWLRRTAPDRVEAVSAVCPHLGCAIAWDDTQRNYLCPCHDSRFSVEGNRLTGPSERGLDPLPVAIKDGRLQLTWLRFKSGGGTRELA